MTSHEVISLNKKPLNINLQAAAPAAEPPPEIEPEPADPPDRQQLIFPQQFDDPKVKYSLVIRANEYFRSPIFSSKVQHLCCDVNNLSVEELTRLLGELDACINSSVGLNFAAETFYFGMGIGESLIKSRTQWKVNGLTQTLRANKEMDEVIEALRLKYASGAYITPEYKALFIIFNTVRAVDAMNRNEESIAAAAKAREEIKIKMTSSASQDNIDKYKDL